MRKADQLFFGSGMTNRNGQLSLARRGKEARLGQQPMEGRQRKRDADSLSPPSPRVSPSVQGWVLPETAKADLDAKVEVLDLTRRSANVLADRRIRSIRQLLSEPKTKLLQSPGFGLQSMAEIERKVSQYVAGKWPPRVVYQDGRKNALGVPNPGTKALVDHMLSILPEREQGILAARFGLWDGKTQTLASIGNKLGLSRERIRQIEARELRRLGENFRLLAGKESVRQEIRGVWQPKAYGA